MLRDDWKFHYKTADVLAAAQRKREHHENRLGVWRDELTNAETKLRAEGVTFREVDLGHSSSTSTYRGGVEVTVNSEMQKKLSEARSKVAVHESAAAEYADWTIILNGGANRDEQIVLDYQDIKFFGLTEPKEETAVLL
jgi:hypothetical protein